MAYRPSFHQNPETHVEPETDVDETEVDFLERKSSLVNRERRRKQSFLHTGRATVSTLGLGSIRVHIYKGLFYDVNDVDVIAYSAKKDLVPTTGLPLTLFAKAGDVMKKECHTYVKKNGALQIGYNVLTSAGNLPFEGIIHALGPDWRDYRDKRSYGLKLHDTITKVLDTAKKKRFYRIAMSVIGADNWPPSETSHLSEVFLKAVRDFCEESIPIITDIHIVDNNEKLLQGMLAAFENVKGDQRRGVPGDSIQRHLYQTGLQRGLRLPMVEESLFRNQEHSETKHCNEDAKPRVVRLDTVKSDLYQHGLQTGRQKVMPIPMDRGTLPRNQKHSGYDYYRMDAKQRGICLIINNREFHGGQEHLATRVGTEKDAHMLKRIFWQLHFSIQEEENLESQEMIRALGVIGLNRNHGRFDCFVCCILSHGFEGHVYGSDGRIVAIKTLTSYVQSSMCPTLAGKPKLFFIQACQGDQIQEGLDIETDATPRREGTNARNWIPDTADFLLGYSTAPGYAAIRNRQHGSWYINKLVEILDTYHDKMDMTSMLEIVNSELSQMESNSGNRQMSFFYSTLRKKRASVLPANEDTDTTEETVLTK